MATSDSSSSMKERPLESDSHLINKRRKLSNDSPEKVDQLFIRDLANAASSTNEGFVIDPRLDRDKKGLSIHTSLKEVNSLEELDQEGPHQRQQHQNLVIASSNSSYNLDVLSQYPNIDALRETNVHENADVNGAICENSTTSSQNIVVGTDHQELLLSPGTEFQNSTSPISGTLKKQKRNRKAIDEDNDLKSNAMQFSRSPLYELAHKVQQEQRGPRAEQWRQIYGMTWLIKCSQETPNENVPRNRIYVRYVEVCSEFGLRALSPASFGKLVRILYPNIKTRRLGVRGHSRYHYCGLQLIGDLNKPTGHTPQRTPTREEQAAGLNNQSIHDTIDSDSKLTENTTQVITPLIQPSGSKYSDVFSDMDDISLSERHSNQEIVIPDLWQFLHNLAITTSSDSDKISKNTKDDSSTKYNDIFGPNSLVIINELHSSYCKHCRALIDALRFMQIKKLFTCLDSFFSDNMMEESIRPLIEKDMVIEWIRISDWLMYKEMVEIISPLALQEIPTNVAAGLRNLAISLPTHISKITEVSPKLIEAKLSVANQFVHLVTRLLEVNDAALNAGRILVSSADIDNMRHSWTKHVNAGSIVARELNCSGQKDVIDILQHDIPKLLSMTEQLVNEEGTQLHHNIMDNLHNGNNNINKSNSDGDNNLYSAKKSEAAIIKWGLYLASLPSRFPTVPPRLFLLTTSTILTIALRDISIGGGEGFGPWWIVRCWIDDWMTWMAELGGYLEKSTVPQFEQDSDDSQETIIDKFVKSVNMNHKQLLTFPEKSASCLGLTE